MEKEVLDRTVCSASCEGINYAKTRAVSVDPVYYARCVRAASGPTIKHIVISIDQKAGTNRSHAAAIESVQLKVIRPALADLEHDATNAPAAACGCAVKDTIRAFAHSESKRTFKGTRHPF